MNVKILVSTSTHTYISVFLVLQSVAQYFIYLQLMSMYFRFENFNDINMNFQSLDFHLSVLEVVAFCVLLDVGIGLIAVFFGIVNKPEEEIILLQEEFKEIRDKPKKEMLVKFNDDKKYIPCKHFKLKLRLWSCILARAWSNSSNYKFILVIKYFISISCLFINKP